MDTPEGRLVNWNGKMPEDLAAKIRALAEYEGKTIQEVQERVWRMFFEAIGPIPEKKSFLAGQWPGKPPKRLKA